MKICFPIGEDYSTDSRILEHLGSAPILMVVDTDTGASVSFNNRIKSDGHQCVPFKALRGMSIDAAVADSICDKALNILTDNGVAVFIRPSATISGTLQLILSGKIAYLPPRQVNTGRGEQCLNSRHCLGGRLQAREGHQESQAQNKFLVNDWAYSYATTVPKEERT